MADGIPSETRKRLALAAAGLAATLAIGTAGYRLIGGPGATLVDCFYMTFITVATIGFGEVIDLSHSPGGRLFTIAISLAGVGTMTYLLVTITGFVVEGHVNAGFRRKRMEKLIARFREHFVVCGVEGAGTHILSELHKTRRPFVVVDSERVRIDRLRESFPDLAFIEGDPTDNATLQKAGLEHAAGLFAVTADDNQNLVISLTAKQLNPRARVVVSCQELRNAEKMKKAGADAVVSPTFIGGLRMASEMIRPAVVSFLDVMMSRKDEPLRVEEVVVSPAFAGAPIAALDLKQYRHLLLLAVRSQDDWIYNPPRDYLMKAGDTLIIMT
ncbi:MAG: NAD-binding protein, partial [Acidobacteriota bacterium]